MYILVYRTEWTKWFKGKTKENQNYMFIYITLSCLIPKYTRRAFSTSKIHTVWDPLSKFQEWRGGGKTLKVMLNIANIEEIWHQFYKLCFFLTKTLLSLQMYPKFPFHWIHNIELCNEYFYLQCASIEILQKIEESFQFLIVIVLILKWRIVPPLSSKKLMNAEAIKYSLHLLAL